MNNINDLSLTARDREFCTDGFSDEELIDLVEQTGIKEVTVELEMLASSAVTWSRDRWTATVTLDQHFRYWCSETSPLRAIAGAVIVCYLAIREADAHSGI